MPRISFEKTGRGARAFLRGEDGGLTWLAVVIFMLIVIAGGLAVDVANNEYKRARLQGTLDRAVLAAADLDQTGDQETVVRNYMAVEGLQDLPLDVEVFDNGLTRRVSAYSRGPEDTLLIRMLGFDTLPVVGGAVAEENTSDVEISLVLDISTSMRTSGRLEAMQNAAKQFVIDVLPETDDEVGAGVTTVSLVPYSMSVNVGEDLLRRFMNSSDPSGTPLIHDLSFCAAFEDEAFDTLALNPAHMRQADHFIHNDKGRHEWAPYRRPETLLCPRDASIATGGVDVGRMIPFATRSGPLVDAIDALEPVASTGIDNGMRWAVNLLDPSARPIIADLVDENAIDADADGRPVGYARNDNVKIIVFMTDGDPDGQRNLNPALRGDGLSNVFQHTATGKYMILLRDYRQVTGRPEDDDDGRSTGGVDDRGTQPDYPRMTHFPGADPEYETYAELEEDDLEQHALWYWVNDDQVTERERRSNVGRFERYPYTSEGDDDEERNDWDEIGGELRRLTYAEVFDRFTIYDFTNTLYWHPRREGHVSDDDWRVISNPRSDTNDRAGHNSRMMDLCNLARQQRTVTDTRPNILIYTIGFEMDGITTRDNRRKNARDLLRDCASGLSYYYDTEITSDSETVSLAQAFEEISLQINALRLVR
ncbi:putative Flp pilus-assembly TadE/G-like protein [Hasllibacter halocynthiae]|uniref:Putative Flp pilus-assembly TadE/G-like protein n=1 Tax=Hasllibacter halocynthiae TaxID=595589 RepID=A0A2T0X704_9RHOB|nr:Tad domain-containing protein [Hasllibacter halocynthiae]PRY94716.1 putative Flp pilus-assembly TadE/G-like protein [Hasllibacter halocynthiae]